MKKTIAILLSLLAFNAAHAEGQARLSINIAGNTEKNTYFLCVYNVGCLSMKIAKAKHREYPITTNDIANLKQLFIANGNTMQLYRQPITESCHKAVEEGQKVTITGQLVVTGTTPHINHLQCKIG